ncbi:M23 family metallopeptidase [Kitasatospora terrestris]|uniref:M23ase beta-sheet core domain-containing protein n=1 Tax=Kitasatospora terrestris TaxID=258051 RepID=A0ABP9DPS3_9ACTN
MRSLPTAGRRLLQAIGSSQHVRSMLSADRTAALRLPFGRAHLASVRKTPATAVWGGAAVLAFGVLLMPGHAAAQTVHPTTPGSSVFTTHGAAVEPVGVQIAEPSAYEVPAGESTQDRVAVAANLTDDAAVEAQAQAAQAQAQADAAAAAQAADQAARDAQRAALPAAGQPAEQPAPAKPSWSSPAPGAQISNPYGKANAHYAAGYHTGTDFAVSVGTPLLAVGDATVVSAGPDGAYGNEIVLKLSDGKFAQYAHMSKLSVKAGQHVSAGDTIGLSGNTGNSTGPHLHFEIRNANRYAAVIDPLTYLKQHGANNF